MTDANQQRNPDALLLERFINSATAGRPQGYRRDDLWTALRNLEEQQESLGRLVDRAAELLANSSHPRGEAWHDRHEAWLADARPFRTSNPASEPGLLDDAEGRAVSMAADARNSEGEALQEELQRLRDADRASFQKSRPSDA